MLGFFFGIVGLDPVCVHRTAYLAWSVALQFKHVHGVVDPSAVVIKLNVPRQALNAHLDSYGQDY